jgi:AcrR family transcriptional regulator
MSITRTRLSSDESRAAAIAVARRLLIEHGPQAVTLKAVASKLGRSHANLLHHFGSAAGLQSALAQSIAKSVTSSIGDAVERARKGEADPREIVDRTFDAFSQEGAGALAAWMILSGNRDALNPILEAIRDLVEQLRAGHEGHRVPELTLSLVLSALGDALLGPAITQALGLSADAARDISARALRGEIEARHPRS